MLWLLTSSGVLDAIGDRAVTIIAPSEEAFREFKFLDYYGVLSNPVTLAEILRRHIVLGVYDAEGLIAAGTVTNLAGEQLRVWRNGGFIMVDDVTLTLSNTNQANVATFVVYGADRLL